LYRSRRLAYKGSRLGRDCLRGWLGLRGRLSLDCRGAHRKPGRDRRRDEKGNHGGDFGRL
ncbi:MAG: hypothetical protein ACO3DD_08675, partial [Burkholderiaceae bacterium]